MPTDTTTTTTPATPAAAPAAAPAAETTAKGKPPAAKAPVEARGSLVDDIDVRANLLREAIASGKFGRDDADDGGEAIDLTGDAGDDDEVAAPAAAGSADAVDAGEDDDADDAKTDAKAADEDVDEAAEKAEHAALEREAAFERKKRSFEKSITERETRLAREIETANQQLHAAWQQIEGLRAQAEKSHQEAASFKERLKDPAFLLPLIAEHIPAEQLTKHLEEGLSPAKQAEWAIERKLREAQKPNAELEEIKQTVQSLTKEIQTARAAEAQRKAEADFAAHTKGAAADVPLAAALLARNPERYFAMAHQAADRLARTKGSTTFDDIATYIEEELRGFQLHETPATPRQEASLATEAAPSPTVTRARTLTNRTTAGRSTLPVDEGAGESVEDRATALKLQLRRR